MDEDAADSEAMWVLQMWVLRRLVDEVYKQPLSEEAVKPQDVSASCPSIDWLVQCALQAPLPPGWCQVLGRYANAHTFETAADHPFLHVFVDMAHLLISEEHQPRAEIEQGLSELRVSVLGQARQAQEEWAGPILDPGSGDNYYFCESRKWSSWQSPFIQYEYLVSIIDSLASRPGNGGASCAGLRLSDKSINDLLADSFGRLGRSESNGMSDIVADSLSDDFAA